MKKKILFVMESLGIGGAEKSLVTLLSQFDYLKYDVDLFLFRPKGEFMNLLPKDVNVLEAPKEFMMFDLRPAESIKQILKEKSMTLFINRFMFLINLSIFRYILKKEYIGWKYISRTFTNIEKEYDVTVGFLEKKSIYFIVDKVKARKKIGWIHIDYEKIENSRNEDKRYFEKLDNIITVSNHCEEVLKKEFPYYESKIKVIGNIISPTLINEMAIERPKEWISIVKENITICTVCRLTLQKGIDIAIECCDKLVAKSLDIKWIVVGDGCEMEKLTKIINDKKLADRFILIGNRSNPYPYIKNADIYVQPSRWEGFGITVAEAKVLGLPIVVSNIPEFVEQIEDNITGVIYTDINDMVEKIEKLILYKDVREKLTENLKKLNMNNIDELSKLEELF